ncbi:MAG: alpha/beta fold hydrolase [Desulfobulbaceae bacterium]|nr:alpha/beta fold hydrolase [Desulfobulbaceae bacterium]
MTNNIVTILLVVAVGYGVLLAFMYFYQARLLFLPNIPSRAVKTTPSAVGLTYESVDVVTGDDLHLDGWFIPAEKARGVILFFHGNAGNISHRLDSLLVFNKLKFNVLIFDYRGYGRSQGKPSEPGTYLDAEAAWQYLLKQRGILPEKIVLFGRSLGSAVAAHLATIHTPGALIIESGFTSVPELGAQLYPFLPVRKLSRLNYNTRENLQKVSCPVLIVHSPDDEIIPFSHGRALYEAAGNPKSFLQLRGGHNDGFLVTGKAYLDGLDGFLKQLH